MKHDGGDHLTPDETAEVLQLSFCMMEQLSSLVTCQRVALDATYTGMPTSAGLQSVADLWSRLKATYAEELEICRALNMQRVDAFAKDAGYDMDDPNLLQQLKHEAGLDALPSPTDDHQRN